MTGFRLSRHDCTLMLAICLLIGWTLLSGRATGQSPWACVGGYAIATSAYVVGRLVSRHSTAISLALAGAVAGWVVFSGGARNRGPLAPPLHYANANAALVIGAVGLLLLAAVDLPPRPALALGAAALGLVAWTGWIGSLGALAGGALILVLVAAVRAGMPSSVSAWSAGAAALLVLLVSVLVGVTDPTPTSGGPTGAAIHALTERRVHLWHDAIVIVLHHPLVGTGPSSFATASPTAAADPDTRAAHSLGLEVAAETGLPALALLIAALALTLSLVSSNELRGAVGAAALGGFLMQSGVDYTADFPAVTAAVGACLGLATRGDLPGPNLCEREGHRHSQ